MDQAAWVFPGRNTCPPQKHYAKLVENLMIPYSTTYTDTVAAVTRAISLLPLLCSLLTRLSAFLPISPSGRGHRLLRVLYGSMASLPNHPRINNVLAAGLVFRLAHRQPIVYTCLHSGSKKAPCGPARGDRGLLRKWAAKTVQQFGRLEGVGKLRVLADVRYLD